MTERLAASPAAARQDRLVRPTRTAPLLGTFTATWTLALALLGGSVATSWVAELLIGRVDGLSAPPYDLAFFQQVIWNVGQSGSWVSSFHDGSFLGLHFSPVLVIPAFAERLAWSDVRVLTTIHAVAIGALAPAAFLFLRAALRPSRAASALAAGLATPIPIWGAMQDVIRSDFHPEAVGIVFVLLAGWAGLTGRTRSMWSLAIVALATREDVAYAVAVIGLVLAVRGRGTTRRHGRALISVAAIWAVTVFGFVMPWLRDGSVSDTAHYYEWLGGGFAVLAAPFPMTDQVVGALTRPEAWFVVGGMAASLLGLPLLRPRWAVLVLPPLIALLLSAHWLQAAVRLQYSLILMVPLLVSAAFGGRRAIAIVIHVRRRWHGRRSPPRSTPATGRSGVVRGGSLLPLLAAVPAIAGAWIQGSLPPFDRGDPAFFDRPASIDRIKVVVERVPPSALLLADEGLVAPLAGRAAVGRFAATAGTRDDAYVLADRMAWTPTSGIARRHNENITVLESSTRPVLFDDGRFVLWGPQPGRSPP